MILLLAVASVALIPSTYVMFLAATRSVFLGQVTARLIIFCLVGLLFHDRKSPMFVPSDAAHYLFMASEIHNGNWGLDQILGENKSLWSALISPLSSLGNADPNALVIGLSGTLLACASHQILKLGRALGWRGVTFLEPLVFSLSAPVLVFGPSPLRESLFWFSLVLIGIGAYQFATHGFLWTAGWKILVGAIFVSVARIEMGAVVVVWVFILVLLVSATTRDWTVRLYHLMLFVVTTFSALYFVFIVFNVGEAPVAENLTSLQARVVDMQTSGTAVSSLARDPDGTFLKFLGLSMTMFFLGLYSPGAGIFFNSFAFLSWISWFLILVGLILYFLLGSQESSRWKRLVYLVGPALVAALIVMTIDNLGTLIRLKVAVVALLIPLALRGWSYLLTIADEWEMQNISDSIVTRGKWGALRQLLSPSDGRGSESSAI